MLTIKEALTSKTLTRGQRLAYRALPAGMALTGALCLLGPEVYEAAEKDYGCATVVIGSGETAIQGAMRAGGKRGAPTGDPQLQAVITYAAQSAEGTEGLKPGDAVQACVNSNVLNPAGYGSNGWTAEVTVKPGS